MEVCLMSSAMHKHNVDIYVVHLYPECYPWIFKTSRLEERPQEDRSAADPEPGMTRGEMLGSSQQRIQRLDDVSS
jgi:hypothetical protein